MKLMLAALFFNVANINLDKNITEHFKLKDFHCKDCKEIIINKDLITRLDILRKIYAGPLYITSGYRSLERNMLVGGVSHSAHLKGAAVDVVLPANKKRFLWICRKTFPIVLPNYLKNYVHLEVSRGK